MKQKLAIIFILSALVTLFLAYLFWAFESGDKSPSDDFFIPAIFYFSIVPPFIFSEYYLLMKTKDSFPKNLYLTFPITLALIVFIIAELFYGFTINFEYLDGWNTLITVLILIFLGGIALIYGYLRLGLQHWFRAFFQKIFTKLFTFIYRTSTIVLTVIWFSLLLLIMLFFITLL